MDITSVLNAELSSKVQLMQLDVVSSAMEEIDDVAVKVTETGAPAYILELSPMALALFNQASGK